MRSKNNYICSLLAVIFFSFYSGCAPESEEQQVVDQTEDESNIVEENYEQYLGITHPPVPGNVTKIGGALAKAPGQDAKDAEYSFSDVRAGDQRLLWLSKLINRNAAGEVTWEVIDIAAVPVIAGDEEFIIHSCTGKNGDAVAAIAKSGNTEKLSNIVRAWAIDRNTGKLIEMSGDGVTCDNEGLRAP